MCAIKRFQFPIVSISLLSRYHEMMWKCSLNSILLFAVCLGKASAVPVMVDAECIANPMGNPLCINQLGEIMKKINQFGPPGIRSGMVPGMAPSFARKMGTYMQDETQDDQVSVSNAVTGENVDFNQKIMQILRRIAVKNDIKGKNVNTNQKVLEVNRKRKASYDQEDEVDNLMQAIRRIAVSNNIKGDKVNTKQDMKEYNDEAYDEVALKNLIMNAESPKKVNAVKSGDDTIKMLINKLRRIALSNNIKGKNVNTKQDMKEFNDEEQRRIAVANNIEGKNVDTKQDLKEFNDAPQAYQNDEAVLKMLINRIRRIAIANNIKGKNVNTKQNMKEFNDAQQADQYDEAQYDDPLDKVGQLLGEMEGKIQQRIDSLSDAKNASNPSANKSNAKELKDELAYALATASAQADAPAAMQDEAGYDASDEEAADEASDEDAADEASDEDTDDESDDEIMEDELLMDEVERPTRRMTINNNVAENESKTRRMSIENNIEGKQVNTETKSVEINSGKSKAAAEIIAGNSKLEIASRAVSNAEKPKDMVVQAPGTEMIIQKKSAGKKGKKAKKRNIICKKMVNGKAEKADLKQYLEILKKVKSVAQSLKPKPVKTQMQINSAA